MRFSGRLMRSAGGGSTPVVGDWRNTTSGQLAGWEGWVQATNGSAISPGDYTLVLDDGRQGAILVIGMHASSSSDPVSRFRGNGPPPS
jgi:hypothetical protein